MRNSNIAYIICESYGEPSEVKLQPKTINGKVVGEGILQTADEKNRNGRYYSKEELFPQLTCPRTTELLRTGNLLAELTHPLSKDLQRQSTIDGSRTCARFLKIWTEGDNVMGQFVGTNNEFGRSFDLDLKEGVLPAWSLRALGSIEQTKRGAEVKNLRIITWDQVIYPSHPGAYTQRLVTEASVINNLPGTHDYEKSNVTGDAMVVPVYNEQVISYLKSESANLKFIKECFDFVYSGINVSENGTKVLLTTNEGDTIVVNMESYIHNELMNYASKF